MSLVMTFPWPRLWYFRVKEVIRDLSQARKTQQNSAEMAVKRVEMGFFLPRQCNLDVSFK